MKFASFDILKAALCNGFSNALRFVLNAVAFIWIYINVCITRTWPRQCRSDTAGEQQNGINEWIYVCGCMYVYPADEIWFYCVVFGSLECAVIEYTYTWEKCSSEPSADVLMQHDRAHYYLCFYYPLRTQANTHTHSHTYTAPLWLWYTYAHIATHKKTLRAGEMGTQGGALGNVIKYDRIVMSPC